MNPTTTHDSLLAIGLFRNGWLWLGIVGVLVFQAGITYLPFFDGVFQTAPIGWDEWLRIYAAGFAVLLLVETHKALIDRWTKRAGSQVGA